MIKSVDDIMKCPQFGFEDKGKSISIHAIMDGKKKPLVISLGSKAEKLGLVVENCPDEVKVSASGSTWEKEKLVLRLQRDSDKQVMRCLDTIFRGLYNAAKSDIDTKNWFSTTDSFDVLKVKIHPTQTLYSTDCVDWMHIGTGEKHVDIKKQSTPVEPAEKQVELAEKKQNKKRKTADTGVVNTSALLSDINTTKNNAVDTHKLLATMDSTKQHHYKLYKADQICTTLEVGDIWSMNLNGKDSCGITLKAKHMIIVSKAEQEKKEEVTEQDELEVPDMSVFN